LCLLPLIFVYLCAILITIFAEVNKKMGIELVISPLLTMAIMVLLGYLCVKFKYINPEIRSGVSSIMLRLTIPLLTITTLSNQQIDSTVIKNAGLVIIIVLAFLAVMFLVGFLTAHLFRLPEKSRAVHICITAFSSIIFIGYPLIQSLYGDIGIFYAAVAVPVYDIVFFTAGIFIIAKSAGGGIKQAFKKLLNPVTISIFISLFMLLFGWHLPDIVNGAFKTIGSMTTPLAMLFIGMTLATMELKGIYKRISLFAISIIKMLVMPALLVLALVTLGLDKTIVGVIAIAVALPSQTILAAVASEFDSDAQYATEGVFITTIMSMLTIPVLYMFLTHIS